MQALFQLGLASDRDAAIAESGDRHSRRAARELVPTTAITRTDS
jgi:hypothetical protein